MATRCCSISAPSTISQRTPRFDVVYHLLKMSGAQRRASRKSERRRAFACSAASTATSRTSRRRWIFGNPPIGPSARCSICSASRSTATPTCGAFKCRTTGTAIRCAKIIRCAGRRANASPRPAFAAQEQRQAGTPPSGRTLEALARTSQTRARGSSDRHEPCRRRRSRRKSFRKKATRWCCRWARSIHRPTACCRSCSRSKAKRRKGRARDRLSAYRHREKHARIYFGRRRKRSSSAWTIWRRSPTRSATRSASRSCSASPTAFRERAQHIRVLFMELTRIASHCVWLGTHGIDLGAISVFFYCFDLRENILDLARSRGRRAHASELRARRRHQRRSARRIPREARRLDREVSRPHARAARAAASQSDLSRPHDRRRYSVTRGSDRVERHRTELARQRHRVRRAQSVSVLAATRRTISTFRRAPKAMRTRASSCGSTRWNSRIRIIEQVRKQTRRSRARY